MLECNAGSWSFFSPFKKLHNGRRRQYATTPTRVLACGSVRAPRVLLRPGIVSLPRRRRPASSCRALLACVRACVRACARCGASLTTRSTRRRAARGCVGGRGGTRCVILTDPWAARRWACPRCEGGRASGRGVDAGGGARRAGRRGKATGAITLQAYVDALAPKYIIATKKNRKARAQDAIMKDITVAVDALMYTIDFDALVQALGDQTDNWQLILSQKLNEAHYDQGHDRRPGQIPLQSYISALATKSIDIRTFTRKRRSKAEIVADIMAALDGYMTSEHKKVLEALLQDPIAAGEQRLLNMEKKMLNAYHNPGHTAPLGMVSLQSYVSALRAIHITISTKEGTGQQRRKADIITDIMVALHAYLSPDLKIDVDKFLQELSEPGMQWQQCLEQKLRDSHYDPEHQYPEDKILLLSYVFALRTKGFDIAICAAGQPRKKEEIIGDIIQAAQGEVLARKPLNRDELLAELRLAGDNWDTVLWKKLQNAPKAKLNTYYFKKLIKYLCKLHRAI